MATPTRGPAEVGLADADLVQRAARGQRPALAELWRRYRRWVAVILLAARPRGHDLEDLLQEVALALTERIGELRDPRALRGWLRTVARNVAFGAARRSGPSTGLGLPDVPDPRSEQIAEERDQREESSRALELLDGLPPDYREPLVLRCLQGMSQRQIAATLGLSETTVETRLARGRRLLREQFARQQQERRRC